MTTTAAAAAGAVLAAVIVPLILLPGGRTPPVVSSSARSSHKPPPALALPAVGAAGFPASIYPPPAHPRVVLNLVGVCPSASGLQPPGRGAGRAAVAVISRLGQGFRTDLRLTDRVLWPDILRGWEAGGTPMFSPSHRPLPVLYSGPLASYHQAFGPPDMSPAIGAGGGSRTAQETWMIVTGSTKNPALQGEFLLLTRHGHVLVWNAQ
jgi:hypothetical protein